MIDEFIANEICFMTFYHTLEIDPIINGGSTGHAMYGHLESVSHLIAVSRSTGWTMVDCFFHLFFLV